jgi:DNA repair protein RadC
MPRSNRASSAWPLSLRNDRLASVAGLGPAKRQALGVMFELGRRFVAESVDSSQPVRSPRDVAALMAPRMEDLPVEEFHVLILNAQHRLERDVTVTRGILNSSLVHPREVFREAIAERAAAIILVHNHPSGDPTPSFDDRNITDQLVAAGRLLDIPVHDHVIIGRGRYTSFAEAGLL